MSMQVDTLLDTDLEVLRGRFPLWLALNGHAVGPFSLITSPPFLVLIKRSFLMCLGFLFVFAQMFVA